MANVPVKVLLDKLCSPAEITLMLARAGATFALSILVWRLALARDSSASS